MKLKEGDRKNLDMFMNSMSETEKEAFKNMLATGAMTGKAAQELAVANPAAAQIMLQTAQRARATGELSAQSVYAADKQLTAASKANLGSARQATLAANMADEYGKAVVGDMDRAQRKGSLEENAMKQTAELAEQQKKAKEHHNFLASLKAGDEVVTAGGIIGRVKSVAEGFVNVEVAGNTVIKVLKSAIEGQSPKAQAAAKAD
jgi:preprotein translocase YajC subunit